MIHHRTRFRVTSLAAAAGLALLASVEPASAQGRAVTIEGCLAPGDRPGYFALTDELTGDVIAVTGPPELTQHAQNHLMRVTGAYIREGGRRIFRVERFEMLADACAPLYERVGARVQELVQLLRRRAALGVRAGAALDPELIIVGVHAEFETGIDNFLFRPNVEIGFGEVTGFYAINAEAVYRMTFLRERPGGLRVWNLYAGAGPSAAIVSQEFRERDVNRVNPGSFEFDDTDTELGFNVVVGIASQQGFFGELRAGAYGNPAVRMVFGYTF